MSLTELAIAFIRAVENGAAGDDLNKFYAPDAIQDEFPNRLLPNGATRDLPGLKEASLRGQKVLSSQTYDIESTLETGNLVAIEARWTGVLAIPIGQLKAGDQMTARFAQFFEFRNGFIVRQRNYDCFHPF